MINLLEPKVYNRISAGEVVERPASIVKELVENSIDAGADFITISVEEGGIKSIEVSDNGCGIEKDDLVLAFTPHATSKIKNVEDLDAIESLGFRGEALASIASVCHVKLSSKPTKSEVGYSLQVDGGVFGQIQEVARRNGTTLTCKDLFYNTPARAKFLRKPKLEEGDITHLVEKFMLSRPDIAFTYIVDGKTVYSSSKGDLKSAIYTIYGKSVYDALIPVNFTDGQFSLSGFVTKPSVCKSNRTFQSLFVNGRNVENYLVSQAVQGVYEYFLMKGKFPIYVLNLTTPADCVDVNVHPSKKEVKFENSSFVFGLVRRAVEQAVLSVDQIATYVSDQPHDDTSRDAYSPFNEQGFNPILKPNEKLSEHEGASYKKVDHFDESTPLTTTQPKDVQYENAGSRPLPPDFNNVKIEEREVPINRPGSPIFFDQNVSSSLGQYKKETEQNSFLSASVNDEIKILGTVFKTYIIAELGESIYFLDQHAGHERLLYDKLVSSANDAKAKQSLLVPYSFTLGQKERELLDRQLNCLAEIGFEIANSGSNYEITALPLVLSGLNIQGFVDELLKEGISYEKKPSQFIHDKLCQSACKHAIKAGDSLSKDECAYLIEQVRKGVMLCPHGRPIAFEMSRKELEKLFKRIV